MAREETGRDPLRDDGVHIHNPDPARAGLTGRCPRCGEGPLFDGFLAVAPSCSHCGLDNSFADSGDGPAAFVILIVGFVVVGLALWAEVTFDPPLWLHFLVWVPLIVVLGLAALRLAKGLLIAYQFSNQAAEGRLDRDPRGDEDGRT